MGWRWLWQHVMLPVSFVVLLLWVVTLAPLSFHELSRPARIVYTVINCLMAVVVLLNTLRVGVLLWAPAGLGSAFLPDVRRRYRVTVATVLDVYLSTALSFAALAMSFWLWDKNRALEHDFNFEFLGRVPEDTWSAAAYFFALSSWPGAGTMLPNHWSSILFTSAYTHYRELLMLVILGVMIASIQEHRKEHRKSNKLYLSSTEADGSRAVRDAPCTTDSRVTRQVLTSQGYRNQPEGVTLVSDNLAML
jgi:hypothetical protein